QATIGGGASNRVTGSAGVVSGGCQNQASRGAATVSGGEHNTADGLYSTVAGGAGNQALSQSDDVPHLGPMAQDFKAAFFPGRDDRTITTLEFDGVALAAIQGLNQKVEERLREKDARIAQLEQRLASLERTLST